MIVVHNSSTGAYKISPAGWEEIESKPPASGSCAFIAMAFGGMDELKAEIESAVRSTGYKPLRIDDAEYLGGVMDEILAQIRESKFVIADLTNNRGGVYYEAGFAVGLGIPVIPTCRKDHLDDGTNRVHFDVQHLNLLAWETDKLSAFGKRLENRILSVFGRGPLPPPA